MLNSFLPAAALAAGILTQVVGAMANTTADSAVRPNAVLTAIPGCVLWLDAAESEFVCTTADSRVSRWIDRGGKGLDATQTNADGRPWYDPKAINGRPGIVFNGDDAVNMRFHPFGLKMATVFLVGQRGDKFECAMERVDSALNRAFTAGVYDAKTWDLFTKYRVNGRPAAAATDWGNVAPVVVAGVEGAQMPAGLAIGFGSPGFAPLHGTLGEIVVYDRPLAAAEISSVEEYLLAKWAIAPSGNAFRPVPPPPPAPLPEFPAAKSEHVRGIRWLGDELRDRNSGGGDVWSCTWADDDHLYAVADDTIPAPGNGPRMNLSIFRIEGTPPGQKVVRVNEMTEYFASGRWPWWKGSGMASIDGVLYLGVYSQSVPDQGSASRESFNAQHASIIKSTDHGRTWAPEPIIKASDRVNVWPSTPKPMFPGKEFPTPFFVQYGKDYSGAMDEYVYLCSNDGGWNNWNRMMLARVPRAKFGALDRKDWEFFVSADAENRPTWTSEVGKAGSIFEHRMYTGMTGIQWFPALQRFVMGQWSYVNMKKDRLYTCMAPGMRFPWPEDAIHGKADQTMLCFYEAPKPWGPWRLVHAETPWGPSYYNPCFPAKWFEDGGRRAWIVQSGNFRGGGRGGYQFITRQLEWLMREQTEP